MMADGGAAAGRPAADQRALIAAPTGDDAGLLQSLLADAGIAGACFGDLEALSRQINDHTLLAVVSQEALTATGQAALAEALAAQPEWSDLPLIILTPAGDRSMVGRGLLSALEQRAHVVVLQRPLHAYSLISALRSARDSRLRQHRVRDDLRRRRSMEAALQESEARFRTMADGTPVMIWVTDAAGQLQFVNRAYREFFGVTLDDVRGPKWRMLVHSEDAGAHIAAFEQALRTASGFHSEARVRRADGQWRWVESHAAPRFDAAGAFAGLVGSSPDVTERRGAEEALREADRRKNRFLATLAHELRNPLAPIRNAVEVLRLRTDADPALQRPLAMIDRQVDHLVRLIDDLLDVSRIDRGRLELRRERADLVMILDQAIEATRPRFEEAGLVLERALPTGPIPVNGDPVRLHQVFLNLLDNAAKYTPAGGRVTVGARVGEGRVVASVRDDGIGIAPGDLPQLFEMFTQVGEDPNQANRGLGLGLWLVDGLVKLHGGRLQVRSDGRGKGSEFTVRLPLVEAEDVETAAAEERAPPPAGERQGLRILIADDDPDVADSLAMLLELKGHQVRVARDGGEAVAAVIRERPQVALLDIGMPGIDGYAACRRIREQCADSRPRLMALSGWSDEEHRRRSREAGFDAHLAKPVDVRTLMDLLAGTRAHDD